MTHEMIDSDTGEIVDVWADLPNATDIPEYDDPPPPASLPEDDD